MSDNRFSPVNTNELLAAWEESYKKGLLSFWILLQLHQRPSYPFEMREQIRQLSQETISAEENSIYRALRRFEDLRLVTSQLEPTGQGPDRRYYRLTPAGLDLLRQFIRRNILVFQAPPVEEKIGVILAGQ